jgi:broad specificity phosphatase PhoE
VAEPRGLAVRQLAALREVDVGSWSGLTREEAERRFPEAYRRWAAGAEGWDDGETYGDLSRRVVAAVLAIGADHPNDRVLVVAHGGSIRSVHAAALGVDVHAYRRIRPVEPNATLSAVCVEEARLTELCRTEELDEFLVEDQRRRREAATRPPTPAG